MPSRNRGKPKRTLRDLSRNPLTKEERADLSKALRSSDAPIATAILGATIIEYELETELRTRFRRKDDDTWKELTGESGPLGTFHQKIIAAYGFGILDSTLLDGMNTVRRIRNAFAHSRLIIDFDHDLVVKELKQVALPAGKRSKLYERLALVRLMDDGPRTAYTILCLTLSIHLLTRRDKREAKTNQARRNRRRKELAAALRWAPTIGGLGLLGSLGGSQLGDPFQRAAASLGLLGAHPATKTPDKKDK